MNRSRIKALIAPLGLAVLLVACQQGHPRYQAQPVGYAPAYDDCRYTAYGCGDPRGSLLTSGRICPPGYRLTRLSYRQYGGSARGCIPVPSRQTYRYASAPPAYDAGYRSYRPAPCPCGRRYREVRSEPIRRGGCCR